jgi:molybdopterin/thiamine biosynthesis adenylyltransferase
LTETLTEPEVEAEVLIEEEPELDRRTARQRTLLPPERLATTNIVVVGVGAGGHQTAIQLASLGAPRLTLFDDDFVAEENLYPQGYRPDQLGLPKVIATGEDCHRINPDCAIDAVPIRLRGSSLRTLKNKGDLCVFCCVDDVDARRFVWQTAKISFAKFFVDGRATSEVIHTLAYDDMNDDFYEKTLFEAKDAFAGPCTAQATIYVSAIAAGLAVHQFSRWLRGLPLNRWRNTSLHTGDMFDMTP